MSEQPVLRDAAQREAYLTKVAETHRAWEGDHLESAEYAPDSRPNSDDYNMWYLDLNASPEAESAFMQATSPEGGSDEPASGSDN